MRRSNIVCLVAMMASGLASSAAAQMFYENASGGGVLVYGQFNPAWLYVDDGFDNFSNLVDNAHSNTRVGIDVKQPFGANNFGFKFETGLGFPASSNFSQIVEPDFDWDRTDIRHVDFSFGGDWGKVYAGQGSMATDGTAQSDLSGTTLVTYVSINDTAGDFFFRDSTGVFLADPPTIDSVNTDLDGGRLGRIRYDSPSFNGFRVAIAYGRNILSTAPDANEDKYYDLGLRYANNFDTVEVVGALGYAQRDLFAGGNTKDTMGSFSVLHQSGINFTAAAGSREDGGQYAYGKLGYKGSWFPVGTTALAIDYYNGSDFDASVPGDEFNAVGVGVVQNFDEYDIEGYFGYRNYDLNSSTTDYENIESYMLGARWKF